jgi:hypothetical protein
MNQTPIGILSNTIFDIKEKITDQEYRTLMDALSSIHRSDTSTGLCADKKMLLEVKVGPELVEEELTILEKDTEEEIKDKIYSIIDNITDCIGDVYEIDQYDVRMGNDRIIYANLPVHIQFGDY